MALADIAAEVAEETAVPVTLLDGYLRALVAVAATGRRLTRHQLDACHDRGMEAAGAGVALPALVDACLTAAWRAPGRPGAADGPGRPVRAPARRPHVVAVATAAPANRPSPTPAD